MVTSSRLVVARGPRAAEARLLRELGMAVTCLPAELGLPVRVVTPSRSLRLHVGRRLVAGRGRAVAGVVVQTLYGVALEILERVGSPPPTGASTWELLVRRAARQEPALARDLDRLEDGYAAVVSTARDLFDAGLEAVNAEALLEQLGELEGGGLAVPVAERAAALVRVAAVADAEAEALGAARASTVLRRAAEALAADPEVALPARRLVLHGFADATGVAGDLIVALLRHRPAVFFLDRPLDPVDGGDATGAFSQAFAERVRGAVTVEEEEPAPPGPSLAVLTASDPEAEVREAVEQVARCLEEGMAAEEVAIVARDLEPYAPLLRRHCDRLGVPFSGVGATVPAGAERAASSSLARLLQLGPRAPVEVWLEATALGEREAVEVASGLRTRGAARLEDVARALGMGDVVLPVVAGWSTAEARDGVRTRRRRLPADTVARWAERAQAALDTFASWPEMARPAAHLEAGLDLLPETGAGEPPPAWLEATRLGLHDAAAGLPSDLVVERSEWVLVACRALERVGSERMGGCGGGVQVMDAMEARGRTCARLFLLGLNRDSFPRAVSEDPLLPDEARLRLAPLLPDIPVKERGWDEERFLFAQLAAAASDRVTLSWHASEEGRAAAPSPFVVRLGLAGGRAVGTAVPVDPEARPRTAFDRVTSPEVAARRSVWRPALEAAAAEGRERFPSPTPRVSVKRLAAARAELLEELDPERPRPGLGPFSGCVGPAGADDPRGRPPFVTLLEGVAWCPWQAFVEKLLRVEAVPDPLAELPTADHLLVGATVHGVLERLVEGRTGPRAGLDEVARRAPANVAWPADADLARLLGEVAREAADGAGLGGSGVEGLLEVLARPYLEAARWLEWGGSGHVCALGAEVTGSVEVEVGGRRRSLGFRADRVDRGDRGEVRLTDYKTGKAVGPRRIVTEVARGGKLQAVAYSLAGPEGGGWVGRYAYLSPDGPAVREVGAGDTTQVEGFLRAVGVLLEALDRGAFPPRLVTPGGGDSPPCRTCAVRDACLKGDSGFRARLEEWTGGEPGDDPLERAAHALWWLGWQRPGGGPADQGEEEE